jgi:hypothetical protein
MVSLVMFSLPLFRDVLSSPVVLYSLSPYCVTYPSLILFLLSLCCCVSPPPLSLCGVELDDMCGDSGSLQCAA